MNTLDRTLELFAHAEPDARVVQDAQRKLEQAIAGAAPRKRKVRMGGWLAAAASAVVAVMALLVLPFGPMPALAFSEVQQHFRDFDTLRFEIEQRMNGDLLVKQRVSVLANGSVRAEVGEDIVVIVNTQEMRVMTLVKPERIAVVTPLDNAGTKEDATDWLQDIRDFQGAAKALPGTRFIRGQRAMGWELPMEQGKVTLWANQHGLPLEMQLDQGVALQMSFRFEFDAELPDGLFSTEVPAGYTLGTEED
jgi:outer membrane lipoprotein-sorting protein